MCAFLVGNGASAHPEFNPVTTNRYLKLDLITADEVRLSYTLMVGAGPALGERKRADANADGTLDETEAQAMGARARHKVALGLKLRVDGKPVALRFETPSVGLAGREVGPSPFSIELAVRVVAQGARPHTLLVEDDTEVAELGETELRIEESPSTMLLEAHRGPAAAAGQPVEKQDRILFRGPKFSALEDRTMTIRFDARARPLAAPGDASSTRRLGLLAAGLGVLALLGGILLRRKKTA
jgi:hypothetical protein